MATLDCVMCGANLSDTYDKNKYVLASFKNVDGEIVLDNVKCPHHRVDEQVSEFLTSYFRGV